jgi:hypothetical protein
MRPDKLLVELLVHHLLKHEVQHVHVADNLDLGDLLQSFAHHLKQETGEIARDAFVVLGSGQMLHHEARAQPMRA